MNPPPMYLPHNMMYTVAQDPSSYYYGSSGAPPVYWPPAAGQWYPPTYAPSFAPPYVPPPPPQVPETADGAERQQQQQQRLSRAFAPLRSDLLADLRRLLKTQVMSNKVTPFIGLRSAASVQPIVGPSPSLQTFEFHRLERARQTPVTVMREVHRLIAFMVAQVSENIHQAYAPAMTCGLRMLRTLLRFYDTRLTDDLSGIDEEQDVDLTDADGAHTTTVTTKEARSALQTLSYFLQQQNGGLGEGNGAVCAALAGEIKGVLTKLVAVLGEGRRP